MGPPSSRTTRSPRASLPSERPRVSASTAMGAPTGMSRKVPSEMAAPAASSTVFIVAKSSTITRTQTNSATVRSSSSASALLGSRAGLTSRATASPVTN